MKLLTILTLLICSITVFAQQKKNPKFNDFKVKVYSGKIKNPKWAKRISKDEWRDETGNFYASNAPQVNFAGKYYITFHSCGTSCIYYNFTDLSTGKELDDMGVFGYGDEATKTPDGFDYTSDIFYQKDSKLLIAQFTLEKNEKVVGCRQRAFIFENNKLSPYDKGKMVPLTKNYTKCRKPQ
jgi:hypothetical protein